MPAPTSYTETALKDFMVAEIGAIGVALGLTASSTQIVNAVYSVERLLALSDVADATDMTLVESAARWEAWRTALNAAVAQPSKLKSSGDELDFSERLDAIRELMAYAESAYYTATAIAEGSDGMNGFVFATVPGCRGR